MAEDWASAAEDVAAGLLEAGTSAVILRKGERIGGPDYAPTFAADQELPVTIVYDAYKAHEIDGTQIRATDIKVLMAAGTVTPQTSDKLRADQDYSIQRVAGDQPGGTPVMWKLQCRAA